MAPPSLRCSCCRCVRSGARALAPANSDSNAILFPIPGGAAELEMEMEIATEPVNTAKAALHTSGSVRSGGPHE